MSDSHKNESEQRRNPIPIINVRPFRLSSNRTVSFPSTHLDSLFDPPVTTESQEAHGYNEEQNTNTTNNPDPTLHPIEEEESHRQQSVEFSTFPKRIKKGTSPNSHRFPRSHQYGTPHSSAWSALKHFNDGLSAGTPPPIRSEYIFQRSYNYDEPLVMSPGEESVYSVIMDDGSYQRRRISLTSEYSRPTEQTPLLHDRENSDSDVEDTDQRYNNYRHDTSTSKIKKFKAWLYENTLSQNRKNIMKCALAYFLASLFTFIPILNEKTGLKESQNSHLVATVAVFFNPAKTVGGMYEAVGYSLLGGLFGSLVTIGSMASAVWFNANDHNNLGCIISVVVWCGGSMFIVAFLRAKLNKPTFNSACSLANIIIFVIIAKEGTPYIGRFTLDKIIQVTKIILIGVCISFFVSICVWPVSASKKLKTEIGTTLGSFRLLLKLLTKTFLIDDIHYTDKSVQSAIKSYEATFTSLRESLRQASYEIHNMNMQRQLGLYRKTIDSLQRLAQYLGSLRSCCGLQWEIINDDKNKNNNPTDYFDGYNQKQEESDDDDDDFVDLGNLLEIIRFVGPSMKSLAFTCKQTIIHLQDQFTKSTTTFSSAPSFSLLQQNLKSALELFEQSQTRSFTKLYRKKTDYDGRPNEEVFLTYFFVFNLQEFARELTELVDLVDHIQRLDAIEQHRIATRRWWQFWLYFGWFTIDNSRNSIFDKKFYEKIKYKFPENTNNLFNTIQTPIPKTLMQKFTINIWKSLTWFRQFEVKYAFKAAVSAAILVSPAFISQTRELFVEYRGEWACISMMVVMVPTVGGANLIGIYRACGTLFGSFLAWFIYTLFPENGPVMSVFGFFIALGCYHFILYTKYNRIGQFILLTYNLVALYKFNLSDSEEEDLDIIEIAMYRAIAVGTGIIWGVYVTTYWWPYEARVELRKGLSQLFINMSWLYNKLVAVYSAKPRFDNDATDSSNLMVNLTPQALSRSTKEFMEMELYLQLSLLKLKELLSQTPNEPRMKGPFPIKTYSEILMGCQNILDKLLSMRIAVTKEEWYTSIRRDFTIPVSKERKDLVGNTILYFYILAAALRLKTPLPPYLPPAEKARRRLVKKIRNLPVVKQRIIEGNDEHYIVYYAYVLVMEDIIRELEKLGVIMKDLFGCIGGDEFNDFFDNNDASVNRGGENDVATNINASNVVATHDDVNNSVNVNNDGVFIDSSLNTSQNDANDTNDNRPT
ncbi:Fusaric acid resistance protein-like-domain-containing protein [Glomus cerebriforme]|uniref:Fusaric acid resistance protein-like-domain-containing protein n=1 Tax=Glomus cerebriforme TaxID=658196 RepID=A0A397TD04_9GLOM|nr:Fusaric acid resistance protein-like-domain-containing protein [Glomus cerebriforme]